MRNLLLAVLLLWTVVAGAQSPATDVFLMPGTDVVRPGNGLKSNLNIGAGHTFELLKKSPVGDEITFSYTYENAGASGWLHSEQGAHTESAGVMKNFALGKSPVGIYTWQQLGITSLTGGKNVQNRLFIGSSLGMAIHFTPHQAIWIQEQLNKVETVPWYTTSSIGYVVSF